MGNSRLTDVEAHQLIWNAYQNKEIVFHFDVKYLARPGSPAWRHWDLYAPILTMMVFSLLVLFIKGIVTWIIFLIFVSLYQKFLAPLIIRYRVKRRILVAIAYVGNFVMMWKFGGMAISLNNKPDTGCIAPSGDWKKFVLLHLVVPNVLEEKGDDS